MLAILGFNNFRSSSIICNKALENPTKYFDMAYAIVTAKQVKVHAELNRTHANPKKVIKSHHQLQKYETLLQKLSQVSNHSLTRFHTSGLESILNDNAFHVEPRSSILSQVCSMGKVERPVTFTGGHKTSEALSELPIPAPRLSLNAGKRAEETHDKPVPYPRKLLHDNFYKQMCERVAEFNAWFNKIHDTSNNTFV